MHQKAALYIHLVLDEVSAYVKTAGEEVLGEMEIPLWLVTGTRTAGRQNAFSKDFLPILPENSEFARKWITLYEAQMEEGIRDPILVYEFMHRFYVQEGNKRVSVMKYLDASRIMARVIRVIPEKTDDPSVKLYYEFMEFYLVQKYMILSVNSREIMQNYWNLWEKNGTKLAVMRNGRS